ncbi:MAG: glutathione S-transferase family protein [Gammaproteobacteria bacterium]|nr:glutathione S-transferase family protein [Gammaproteobacteria bacterium]MDH3411631.1 glutathione S-transferase family protein [Gammaproteobacteria bacterium]
MHPVEIISSKSCPFAQRSRMVLLEKGVDFVLTEIDLENKPDWFLKVSPYSKVPVIRHGEAVIWESAVINEYLDEVFPEPPLLPRDPVGRATARVWIDFANNRMVPHVYKMMLRQDTEGQALHRRRLTEAALFMEHEGLRKLSPGPFWLGDKPGLVDFTFYPHVQRFAALEHYRGFVIPDECGRLRDWIEAMSALPSVQATRRTTAQLIDGWKKYADNSGQGVTAQEMREM